MQIAHIQWRTEREFPQELSDLSFITNLGGGPEHGSLPAYCLEFFFQNKGIG